MQQFGKVFETFNESVMNLGQVDAANWKTNLRRDMLQVFEQLSAKIQAVRDVQMAQVSKMMDQVDVAESNTKLNQLLISRDKC